MVPLVLATPTQMGISCKSFGLALIGGMVTSTLLTLLVVPVFYTFLEDAREISARVLRQGSSRGRTDALEASAVSSAASAPATGEALT
jgi:hypothetical protein